MPTSPPQDTRTSRLGTWADVPAPVLAAWRARYPADEADLGRSAPAPLSTGDPEDVVCVTHHVRGSRPSLLARLLRRAPEAEHVSVAALSRGLLLVGSVGERRGVVATAARVADLRRVAAADVAIDPRTDLVRHASSAGLTLLGPWSGTGEQGTLFVPLADDDAGRAFRAAVEAVVPVA